jgi:response regulator RpfG family c-di-GMP phosphodiesterase
VVNKILFVDDEPNILEAYRRSLKKEFHVETAVGGEQALALVAANGPYAVIVSDMRMPGMDGVQFLARVREQAPDSVRMMLTGNADQQTAIDAVNEGHIFRFLAKPCPPETMAKAVTAGVRQYQLVRAERDLLEKTLGGSIQILADVLSLVNPMAFGRSSRVRRLVRQLCGVLKVEDAWQTEIAATLSQLGCIMVPEETLAKVYSGAALTAEEMRMLQAHPQVGRDLIAHIPRLEPVAEIIAYQEKQFNGSGRPHDGRTGDEIPYGARILKLALDFDKMAEGKFSNPEAYDEIKRRGDWYDPSIVAALAEVLASDETKYELRSVSVNDLGPNMILAEDIRSTTGVLLVAKGQEVAASLSMRLANFVLKTGIQEPINVFVPIDVEVSASKA